MTPKKNSPNNRKLTIGKMRNQESVQEYHLVTFLMLSSNTFCSLRKSNFTIWFLFVCFLKYLFIYLFMAVLGLRFCARVFSSGGEWGPLFIAVRGPLTVAASLVAEHRFQMRRLSNCGSRAQLLRGMWDPPRPGLEPMSPALAGRFSTTAPPGKPRKSNFNARTLHAL